jgi:predicted DNA-binding transcriptional regulator AlpA
MEKAIDFIRTRQETAERLRVSLRTLTRMEQRGDLPRIKISDRIYGFRDSAIDAFLKSRESAS